jgi:hypothetical protein
MTATDDFESTFRDQPKLRTARIVTPLNVLKQKIGSGGIDAATLAKAEQVLENNTIDFKPIAKELLAELDASIESARKNQKMKDEAYIEAIIYPAAQFLALGTLFHYPLISDISDNLINFLETVVPPPTQETLEIVIAHRMAIFAALHNNMMGRNPPQGAELKRQLTDACQRYYKLRKS